MKYEYAVWPSSEPIQKTAKRFVRHEITVCKVDKVTGEVIKVKRTGILRTRQWWRARGFSFNGRIP